MTKSNQSRLEDLLRHGGLSMIATCAAINISTHLAGDPLTKNDFNKLGNIIKGTLLPRDSLKGKREIDNIFGKSTQYLIQSLGRYAKKVEEENQSPLYEIPKIKNGAEVSSKLVPIISQMAKDFQSLEGHSKEKLESLRTLAISLAEEARTYSRSYLRLLAA